METVHRPDRILYQFLAERNQSHLVAYESWVDMSGLGCLAVPQARNWAFLAVIICEKHKEQHNSVVHTNEMHCYAFKASEVKAKQRAL